MTHVPVLVPLVFFLGAVAVPLAGGRRAALAYGIALGAAVVATALSVAGLGLVLVRGTQRYQLGGWAPPIGIELVWDPLAAFLCVVLTGVAALVLVQARIPIDREMPGRAVPFYSAALLLLGGLTGVVITGDLFNLYVFLEISSLATYALLAHGDRRAPVSAFRYLILGTVGASFYLLGLGFVFIATGSLNMADLAAILPVVWPSPALTVGLILMAVGIALKMALFPLHGWLPDAYTHASSAATALIAPIGSKVAAYVLIRVLFHVFEPDHVRQNMPLTDAIAYLAAAGIIWGSVMAIAQADLKRMLAYSSVAQLGYIGLGIGLASPLGLIGAVLHTLNHACMKACLFLVSGNLRTRLGHTDIASFDERLRQRMPWTSAAFAVAAISMIGLPPTAGFFSKWYLVLGSVERAQWLLVAVILVSSLLNAVYFFRVLEGMYLRPSTSSGRPEPVEGRGGGAATGDVPGSGPWDGSRRSDEVPPSMLVPTVVLAVSLLVLGLGNAAIVRRVISLMIPGDL